MLVLTVNIYQERRKEGKVCAGYRSIINPGSVFSGIADYTAKQDSVIFNFDSMKAKPFKGIPWLIVFSNFCPYR